MASFDPDVWFRAVDVAAVAANGLLGGAVARAFRFDVVGFLMLAVASGMGGGMIRDVLLNTGFPVALTDSAYWVAALASAGLAYAIDLWVWDAGRQPARSKVWAWGCIGSRPSFWAW